VRNTTRLSAVMAAGIVAGLVAAAPASANFGGDCSVSAGAADFGRHNEIAYSLTCKNVYDRDVIVDGPGADGLYGDQIADHIAADKVAAALPGAADPCVLSPTAEQLTAGIKSEADCSADNDTHLGDFTSTIKYPGLIGGYSVIVLNKTIDHFDTEPAVLAADGSPAYTTANSPVGVAGKAITTGCDGGLTSSAFVCYTNSNADLGTAFTRTAYSGSALFTAATWTPASALFTQDALSDPATYSAASVPSDVKKVTAATTSNLYTTGAISSAIAIDAGLAATGKFAIDERLCDVSSKATVPSMLVIPSAGSILTPGHQGLPIEVQLSSKYYKPLKGGNRVYYPKGCRFTKASYEDADGIHAIVEPKPKVADGNPYDPYAEVS